MLMKKLFTLTACLVSTIFLAQNGRDFWKPVSEKDIPVNGVRQIIPQKYQTFRLNGTTLKDKLWAAPDEKTMSAGASSCIIYLPVASGQLQAFRVSEASIMEPGLAQAYPQFKTFSVKGIDDPYANGKLDWTEFGFHGMIRSIKGDIFIDPYCNGNLSDYISYYTSDFIKAPSDRLPEAGLLGEPQNINSNNDGPVKHKDNSNTIQKTLSAPCMGAKLRTYRLAVACTGEYAVAATGSATPTVPQTLSKIITSVNRVDGVYETEVAVRMVLVASETVIVYTNASTDPFTGNNNANTLINESQTVINSNITSANYDIGHTFSTGGGGLAYLGCVCVSSNKARGITGSPSPVGDPYDIDYVAHEMGHEFGGNHTFNSIQGSCGGGNRNAGTAVEPGSGITIMAYAGICGGDDLASHSIAYFHGISYDEIVNYTNSGSGNSCPVTTTTGNNPPIVTGSITYTVPKSTPFTLTGSATDPDGDTLTYQWEETDLGPGGGGTWNSGNKPYFESYAPTNVTWRSFPKVAVILTGLMTSTKGEYLPSTPQTLNFRFTARDNKMGGGGVCSASSQVVIDSSGPLAITYPNVTGISWPSGSTQTITWNVNNTNLPPVSCTNVNVLLSYDNGTTFTTTLMSGTANNGSLTITVPTVTTTMSTCRIRVESVGNIFFDINDRYFAITAPLGVNELSVNNAANLSVSPNPFSEGFTLKASSLDASSETVITITDVLGKTVKQESLSGISTLNKTYTLDGVSRGLYFVSVKNSSRQSVARIVKQ